MNNVLFAFLHLFGCSLMHSIVILKLFLNSALQAESYRQVKLLVSARTALIVEAQTESISASSSVTF